MKYGKGNRKAQLKRRRKRIKHLPKKQSEMVLLIDGNYSYYPIAYCRSKHAFLTEGLANTHSCEKRKCNSFRKYGDE